MGLMYGVSLVISYWLKALPILPDDFTVSLQALKRDIINTLSDRCEILFEDLILNEGPQKKSKK